MEGPAEKLNTLFIINPPDSIEVAFIREAKRKTSKILSLHKRLLLLYLFCKPMSIDFSKFVVLFPKNSCFSLFFRIFLQFSSRAAFIFGQKQAKSEGKSKVLHASKIAFKSLSAQADKLLKVFHRLFLGKAWFLRQKKSKKGMKHKGFPQFPQGFPQSVWILWETRKKPFGSQKRDAEDSKSPSVCQKTIAASAF